MIEPGPVGGPTEGRGAGETPAFWPDGDAGLILNQRRFVIPVIGAGVSVGAGLPGVMQLGAWVVENVPPGPEGYSKGGAPRLSDVVTEIGVDERELRARVAAYIKSFELRPTPVSEALVRIPSKFIITLNYDRLIEETANQAGIDCESLTNDEADLERAVNIVGDIEQWPPKRLVILHLHGSVDAPETIVLDPTSYQRLTNRGRFSDLVFLLTRQKTLLFIGTTLDELHLLNEMRRHRGHRRHVLLCHEDEKRRLTEERAGISEARDGIIVATFGAFSELDGFAIQLSTVSRVAIPEGPLAAGPPERRLPFGYVPSVLIEYGQRIEESDRLAAAILGRAYGPEPFGELDVALGQRTLIVGPPGSGKSELLREAGRLVPEDESPLLIRCADLEPESGAPLPLLASVAARGIGLRDEVEISPEALTQRRFHFFLDGLDEKLIGEQEDVARLIVDLARQFPQHRFTVATRPVDAVEAFRRGDPDRETVGEWRVLELAPDRDWQDQYLAAAGVRLGDLEAQMPALRDLSGLLQLPFFLSQTVELHEAGRLRAFRDLWELVQELVTGALERETEIRLPQDEARKWLRDVALAMHLAGRPSLTLEELTEVPLPTAVKDLIGSTEAVADALIVRLLLRKQEGEFAFTHRIVGEALAGEALGELQPEGALLDAVAPRRDDAVSGVRSDWLVPLAFLMGRNPDWRAAVAERDRLAAARSVPISAPVEERHEAARTIWEAYVELRVWIWDYDVPDLIEDAEALGRQLAAGDLDDLVGEIRAAIDHDSPQLQGNAIRVLSRVKPEGFGSDLRRVLEDDEREAVVRRQAAIAARDIGAKELLPLIVKRAASPADSAEAQDCSICAFALAGDEGLIETAIQLVGNRHSRVIAESRMKGRGSGPELIHFLRAYAEAELDPYSRDTSLLDDALQKILRDD